MSEAPRSDPSAPPRTDPSAPLVAGRALRAAARLEPSHISPRAGLVAATGVAGVLAVGTAVGRSAGAVAAGAGAMLSGVAWRTNPGDPPVGTMIAAGTGVALATLAGTLSGRWPWVHLVILAGLCLVCGLLTALGRRGTVVGTQTVIAFIVFGRFPEPAGPAFALAGLVALGAGVQVMLAALVGRPAAWRLQRDAVAAAYERLAEVATAPERSSLAAGAALDAAQDRLSAPALLADPAVLALSNLVEVGRRIRLELGVLGARLGAVSHDEAQAAAVRAALDEVAAALSQVAANVAERTVETTKEAAGWLAGSLSLDARTDARLEALAGQVGAAARIVQRTASRSGRLRVRPSRGSRPPGSRLVADLRLVRANMTLRSPSGRHAIRLAVVVAGTELFVQRLGLPRAYWAVLAAATVLRPEFGATFTRGAERVAGTCVGVVVATLIAVGLAPSGWAIVAIVGMLAWATYTVLPASFGAGMAGLTGVVVFLLHAVAPDSARLALDRGIDTAIGGTIGMLAYALWPTWSGQSVGRLLAAIVDAQTRYLNTLMADLIGAGRPEDHLLRPLARRARIAYGDAEAAVTLAHAEPVRGTDPLAAAAILAGLRRVTLAIHALRIEAGAASTAEPLAALAPVADGFAAALAALGSGLRGGAAQELPPLRHLYGEAISALPADVGLAIGLPLDELVDAVNTVASTAGFAVT